MPPCVLIIGFFGQNQRKMASPLPSKATRARGKARLSPPQRRRFSPFAVGLMFFTQDLFPPLEPHLSGQMQVDSTHKLYWEICGNPKGIPVLFVHGGPGAGASAIQRRFFDPKRWRIILFDQRGAGRSTPRGELRDNTTVHLIEDIETLRQFLGVERWHIFGGSWGSTLALAYGEAHPERCLSFILRGICLMQPSEIEWFMNGIRTVYPEAWALFASYIPPEKQDHLLQAYYDLLAGPPGPERLEATRRWLNYETACSNFEQPAELNPPLAPDDHRMAMPLIEAHYFLTQCYTAQTSLLNGIDRIRAIPATIIQGRYDMVCPIVTADTLHLAWPEANYHVIPNAGHSALEPGIRTALVAATEKMKLLTQAM